MEPVSRLDVDVHQLSVVVETRRDKITERNKPLVVEPLLVHVPFRSAVLSGGRPER